jgi:hypothetical protein
MGFFSELDVTKLSRSQEAWTCPLVFNKMRGGAHRVKSWRENPGQSNQQRAENSLRPANRIQANCRSTWQRLLGCRSSKLSSVFLRNASPAGAARIFWPWKCRLPHHFGSLTTFFEVDSEEASGLLICYSAGTIGDALARNWPRIEC